MISFCGQRQFGPREEEEDNSITFSLSPPSSGSTHSVFQPLDEGDLINWLGDSGPLPDPEHVLKIGRDTD